MSWVAEYVAASFGAFNLRGGAAASFSTVDTSRSIVFPNFLDLGRARYDATKIVGTRTRIAEALNRKRGLSIMMIRRLHERPGISAEVLIRPSRKKAASPVIASGQAASTPRRGSNLRPASRPAW